MNGDLRGESPAESVESPGKQFELADYEALLELAKSGMRNAAEEIAKAMSLGNGGLAHKKSLMESCLLAGAIKTRVVAERDVSLEAAEKMGKRIAAKMKIGRRSIAPSEALRHMASSVIARSEDEEAFITTVFVAAGANVNFKDKQEVPLLNDFARNGKIRSIEILLKAGADVGMKGRWGETALEAAAVEDRWKVLEVLKKAGAVLEDKNWLDETPLFSAIKANSVSSVEKLLSLGANPNAEARGESALMAAVLTRNERTVSSLLKFGAEFYQGEDERLRQLEYESNKANEALGLAVRTILNKRLNEELPIRSQSGKKAKA